MLKQRISLCTQVQALEPATLLRAAQSGLRHRRRCLRLQHRNRCRSRLQHRNRCRILRKIHSLEIIAGLRAPVWPTVHSILIRYMRSSRRWMALAIGSSHGVGKMKRARAMVPPPPAGAPPRPSTQSSEAHCRSAGRAPHMY